MKSLNHPNIIQIKEFIEDPDLSYHILIFEYFDAITLKEFILQNEYKNEHFSIIFAQIYRGLLYLHEKKILHRDFNINNILINVHSLDIKIIDFGLAKYITYNCFMMSPPQGNFQYRTPIFETLVNPFFEDVWNFAAVGLSLLKRHKMTSRKVQKLLKDFQKNPAEFEESEKEITRILEFLKNEINEACDDKEDYEIMDLKSPLEKFTI